MSKLCLILSQFWKRNLNFDGVQNIRTDGSSSMTFGITDCASWIYVKRITYDPNAQIQPNSHQPWVKHAGSEDNQMSALWFHWCEWLSKTDTKQPCRTKHLLKKLFETSPWTINRPYIFTTEIGWFSRNWIVCIVERVRLSEPICWPTEARVEANNTNTGRRLCAWCHSRICLVGFLHAVLKSRFRQLW